MVIESVLVFCGCILALIEWTAFLSHFIHIILLAGFVVVFGGVVYFIYFGCCCFVCF